MRICIRNALARIVYRVTRAGRAGWTPWHLTPPPRPAAALLPPPASAYTGTWRQTPLVGKGLGFQI